MDSNNYDKLSSLLFSVPSGAEEVSTVSYFILLIISAFSSILISYLYIVFFNARSTGSQIYKSFPLLGTAVTALFLGIQFSLPLSLGLLGALSIVRFRTPIKEPEEIAFIMVVIANAIAIATFNVVYSSVIIAVSFIILIVLSFIPKWDSHMKTYPILSIDMKGWHENLTTRITDIATENHCQLLLHSIINDNETTSLQFKLKDKNSKNVEATINSIKTNFPDANVSIYGL